MSVDPSISADLDLANMQPIQQLLDKNQRVDDGKASGFTCVAAVCLLATIIHLRFRFPLRTYV